MGRMRDGWGLGLVVALVGCGGVELGRVACPEGTTVEGGVCRPKVVLDCPAGMGFVQGTGCVPVVATSAPATTTPPPAATTPPAPGPTAPSTGAPVGTAAPASSINPCACAPGDLNCSMRCAPTPTPSPSTARAFDRQAAQSALAGAVTAAQSCAKGDGPRGTAAVSVIFEPSGKASRATVGAPFAQHPVGTCIEGVFRTATVPPFDGQAVTVSKFITVK